MFPVGVAHDTWHCLPYIGAQGAAVQRQCGGQRVTDSAGRGARQGVRAVLGEQESDAALGWLL